MIRKRIMNVFNSDKKILVMLLCVIMISIFSLTIVYAALSVTLNIQGNAQVVASTWDIHLDNVKVTDGSVSGTDPSITSPTTATFSTTLNMPGDFYEFTIDVVNNGSIDAMIDSVSKTPSLTENQAKYLNYIIEYENGEAITTKQLVSKNSFVRLKVRVEFRKDVMASDLPTTSESLNLSFTVNYIQSDGSGSSVKDNGEAVKLVNVVSGDGTQKSDEVCIGDECFYVMYSDEETITMFAKYNLYVGGEYNVDTQVWTAYGDEATGLQDASMIGSFYGKPYKGITPFSETNYWNGKVSSYPAYIYDSNSTLYNYIENYKNYLGTLGVELIEARIITNQELKDLGCDGFMCSGAPSWVDSTSYWFGDAYSRSEVYGISVDSFYGGTSYSSKSNYGCRPVIVIDKSLL